MSVLFSIINHTENHNVILNCLKYINHFFPTAKIIIYSNNKDFYIKTDRCITNLTDTTVKPNYLSEIFAHNENIELAKQKNIIFEKIIMLNCNIYLYTNHIINILNKFDSIYWPLNLTITNGIISKFNLFNKIMICDNGFFFINYKDYKKIFNLIKTSYLEEYHYLPFNIILPSLLNMARSKNYKLIEYPAVKRFMNINDLNLFRYNKTFTKFIRDKKPFLIAQEYSTPELIINMNKYVLNIYEPSKIEYLSVR